AQPQKIQPVAANISRKRRANNVTSHAYLSQGTRGTGAEAIATRIAKNIFCKSPTGIDPCQECRECRRIDSGNQPDVHWIEPDGQSINIEQVESLQQEFTYSELESNKTLYIVNDAATLTLRAARRSSK